MEKGSLEYQKIQEIASIIATQCSEWKEKNINILLIELRELSISYEKISILFRKTFNRAISPDALKTRYNRLKPTK